MRKIITAEYFQAWQRMLDTDIDAGLKAIQTMELEPHSFTFYTSVSVMASSKIEGEQLEIDSYVKHKLLNIAYLPELTEKPNDLYNAYLFAKEKQLNRQNFITAHTLLAAHLLPEKQRGAVRTSEMLVTEHKTGRIQYTACPQSMVEKQLDLLWDEIDHLLKQKMTNAEVFYYAAFIHLVCVNIHPFGDGNGRSGRLLEKWFLAEKLGEPAWYIKSEKYYYKNVDGYYKNLARLGMFYDELDYQKSLPFLLMLPQALSFEK
ncbi:MAG: Fic family protein [Clostridia bacterium]|nr:Fic family protein [Clostridia bacterium]